MYSDIVYCDRLFGKIISIRLFFEKHYEHVFMLKYKHISLPSMSVNFRILHDQRNHRHFKLPCCTLHFVHPPLQVYWNYILPLPTILCISSINLVWVCIRICKCLNLNMFSQFAMSFGIRSLIIQMLQSKVSRQNSS